MKRIIAVLLVALCLAICTVANLTDHATAVEPEPIEPVVVEVIEYKVEPIIGLPPEPSPEPQPLTAADWYGVAPEDLDERLKELYIPTVAEVDRTTKMMPGEFNGPSTTERAQPVWCALNRIDDNSPDFKNITTLTKAITPGAFHAYSSTKPVLQEYKALAIDVITHWINEKLGFTDVGRVLPAEYLFFSGDKLHQHNIYRTTYRSRDPECIFYDGYLPSPYES